MPLCYCLSAHAGWIWARLPIGAAHVLKLNQLVSWSPWQVEVETSAQRVKDGLATPMVLATAVSPMSGLGIEMPGYTAGVGTKTNSTSV